MIELTLFKSIYDNKVNRKLTFETWDNFSRALHKMSTIDGYKPKRGEKRIHANASPLISPAVFKENTRRANNNVLYWSKWAALDIDEYDISFKKVLYQFKDYSHICYSSASSTKQHPKFRIILQLSETVPHDKISHLWYALNKRFSNIADPQTKDLSRIYYVPAKYPNAYNFIFTHTGKHIINPTSLLKEFPFIETKKDFLSDLPDHIKQNVLNHRASTLTNTNVTWTSFKDCPFVNKKMIDHYSQIAYTDGTGRYAYFYKIMLAVASRAIQKKYPITPFQIAALAREIDMTFGGRYKNRPLEVEASRALEYVLRTQYKF